VRRAQAGAARGLLYCQRWSFRPENCEWNWTKASSE
jgi:hypothetical protein